MVIDFALPAELEAHDPPEARGLARDGVRMLVSRRSSGEIGHHGFRDLPDLLLPGDLLVINNTGTLPAEVRPRRRRSPCTSPPRGPTVRGWWSSGRSKTRSRSRTTMDSPARSSSLPVGAVLTLEGRVTARLWRARLSVAVVPYLLRHGVPIRYSYVPRQWALS